MSPDDAQRAAACEAQILLSIVDIAREHLENAEQFDVAFEDLPERRLVADLGLDSVQLLTLAMEVENHFQIMLDDVDPLAEASGETEEAVETVGDLVGAVKSALARKPPLEAQAGDG